MDLEKKGSRVRNDDTEGDDDTASSSSTPVKAKRTRSSYKHDISNMEVVIDDIGPDIDRLVQGNNRIKTIPVVIS